ncbi:MAG: hypothetical protein AAGG38_09020 [Planctomycetota bacterium]
MKTVSRLATRFALGAGLCTAAVGTALADALPVPDPSPAERIQAIEDNHQAGTYHQHRAIQARYDIEFGPMQIQGEMFFTPSMSKVRLGIDGHAVLTYDSDDAWMAPAEAQVPGPPPRFHVLTWPYFVAVPYKLNDPGTILSDAGDLPVRPGQTLRGTKVTFESGVGDTPDDWYIAFTDPSSGLLTALAYIVTYGVDPEQAQKRRSIVFYDDYIDVDGVPIATRWTFHRWNPKKGGVVGDPKGQATLSDLHLLKEVAATTFEKPEGAARIDPPQ